MRALVLFNADFAVWPVHILAAMRARVPALEADAVVVVDRTVSAWLRGQRTFPLRAVHCLSELEPAWLGIDRGPPAAGDEDGPPSPLDEQALDLVATADRELTGVWRGGAVTAASPLSRLATDPATRRRYLRGLTGFLAALMRAHGYDLVLTYSVQDAPSVAAALVAEKFGIPFLSPKAIGFQSATCLFDDVRTMRPCFRTAFRRAAADRSAIPEQSWHAAAAALAAFRARPAGPDYMQLANALLFERPSVLLSLALAKRMLVHRPPESLRYPYPSSRLAWEWRRWLMATRDRHHHRFEPLAALSGQRFAYFPLHYEPESSLLVSAPEHTDQVAVIEAAARALPDRWTLAVKEHRPMLGRRPGGYYDRLARIPRVRLISPFEDGLEVQRAASATMTITGTAGLEGVLLGRPVVFLGQSPIQIVDAGFVLEPDVSRLGEALKRALVMPPADDATLVRFLAALDAASVHVPSRAIWGGTAVVTEAVVARESAHVARFARLILDALSDR